MRYAVVAYASHVEGHMEKSMQSYRTIGKTEPIILGIGNHGFSFQKKLRALYEFACSGAADIIIQIDGWDTCALRPMRDLVHAFERSGAAMAISAETNCFPVKELENQYPPVSGRYRYLNCGMWIAYTSYYRALAAENGFADPVPDKLDQELYSRAYVASPGIFHLDSECRYFHNLFGAEDDYVIEQPRGELSYKVKSQDSLPFISQGNGKSNIAAVLAGMGL